MTKKEMYENQKNFCGEFIKCFVDRYLQKAEETNKKLSKFIEKQLKNRNVL